MDPVHDRGSMDLVHERGLWTRSIFSWTGSMHGGGPWTRGPCFVLSPDEPDPEHTWMFA